jgi:hypothetical protein
LEIALDGPMKLSPPALAHAWFAFPPVRPWPSVVAVTHPPVGKVTAVGTAPIPVPWIPEKAVGRENGEAGAMLAPASGAPTESAAVATSEATREVRSIMLSSVPFLGVGPLYMLVAALTVGRWTPAPSALPY